MARDFEDWDNNPGEDMAHLRSVVSSPHMAPPRVARIEREGELRHKRRAGMIVTAIILVAICTFVLWWVRW